MITSEAVSLLGKYPELNHREVTALRKWIRVANYRSLAGALAQPDLSDALASIRNDDAQAQLWDTGIYLIHLAMALVVVSVILLLLSIR